MTYSERDQMRRVFFEAWRKHRENQVLEPLEAMIIEVILLHSEFQVIFDNPEMSLPTELEGTNPFLHISLHLALREQISTDRPVGIYAIYQQLCRKLQDPHEAEHRMLDCLGQILWDAQQSGKLADEDYYLGMLRKI